MLDKIHLDHQKAVFVASYTVLTRPSGEVESMAVWTESIPTYLPHTQWVFMVVPLGKGTKVKRTVKLPFEAIEDRLTAVPDIHPARYQTGDFPTDAEVTALETGAETTGRG